MYLSKVFYLKTRLRPRSHRDASCYFKNAWKKVGQQQNNMVSSTTEECMPDASYHKKNNGLLATGSNNASLCDRDLSLYFLDSLCLPFQSIRSQFIFQPTCFLNMGVHSTEDGERCRPICESICDMIPPF